jgi:phosphatidylglycerophosphate synthase
MKRKHYSLAEIKNAYNHSEDVEFYRYSIARFFFRPLSFYGAWIFLRIGITANQTTLLSWLMVIFGCFLYLFIPPSSSWLPILLILAWAILDYMDGSMARVTNSRSKYGHFIDVIGAYFMLAFLPICMSIGLYSFPDYSLVNFSNIIGLEIKVSSSLVLILGAFASLNNILLRLIVMRMQHTFSIDPRENNESDTGFMANIFKWVEALISPRGLFFPMLILLTIFNKLELFILIYFIFYTSALLVYLAMYTYKLRNIV